MPFERVASQRPLNLNCIEGILQPLHKLLQIKGEGTRCCHPPLRASISLPKSQAISPRPNPSRKVSFSFFKLEREPWGFKQNFFSLRRINVILRLFNITYLQVAGVQTLHALRVSYTTDLQAIPKPIPYTSFFCTNSNLGLTPSDRSCSGPLRLSTATLQTSGSYFSPLYF